MWISENIIQKNPGARAAQGTVTGCAQAGITVQGAKEHREIPVYAPFGISYVPPEGEPVLLLPVSGSTACAGTLMRQQSLEPGELMLFSAGGAHLVLKNSGEILLNGKVFPREVV